jgi:pyruvate carboxylase subunit B
MLRDNGLMDKYDQMIDEMYDAVRCGGFGTSVTPVSQFYFQQAFNNVMFGKWKKIAPGYGKMVLGYFGKTPAAPDPEVVKWAQAQLGLEPTTKAVVELNDANPELGVKYNTELLQKNGLEVTEENIFIAAACGDKGIAFLKGDRPMGIRYREEEKPAAKGAAAYTATVDGKAVTVEVSADGKEYTAKVNGKSFKVAVAEGAAAPAAKAAASAGGAAADLTAPMPGTVIKVLVAEGDEVAEGQTVVVMEAMKMETEIKAEKAGRVAQIVAAQGAVVAAGDVLAKIEEN